MNAAKQMQLVEGFKSATAGQISEQAIAKALPHIKAISETKLRDLPSYPASGYLVSTLFYVKNEITIDGGKTFSGTCWGVSFPGGGSLTGDVYLVEATSLDDLYARTSSFTFCTTPTYTAEYFWDKDHNLLAVFLTNSISVFSGVGGGEGSWS